MRPAVLRTATAMETPGIRISRAPVYLLADSQLLFWSMDGRPLLARAVDAVAGPAPRAAYVGAANGDRPEFFSIFEGAMELIGVRDRRMIPSACSGADRDYLASADVVVLAGGDVGLGLRVMRETGMDEDIAARYAAGATLVGISAGAVHLGRMGWRGEEPEEDGPVAALGIVPYSVDAHDEANGWRRLRELVARSGPGARGIGVPTGGGIVHHPDGSVRPVRHGALELRAEGGRIVETTLAPRG